MAWRNLSGDLAQAEHLRSVFGAHVQPQLSTAADRIPDRNAVGKTLGGFGVVQ
ncbi:hypothetical protein D3C76_1462420 [compost metagenome]